MFINRREITLLFGNGINKIKRFDLPECRNCKYFKPDKSLNSEESQIKFGKCTYFGEKDLISGEITYPYASIARPNWCWVYGRYYSPK
jgi:hypothetical protein